MRKIICDRCENEIKNDREVGVVLVKYPESGMAPNTERTYELCSTCTRVIDTNIVDFARIREAGTGR